MAPSELTAADPWVRIVTTVVARSLTALQRGSPPPDGTVAAEAVDLVAPDPALCPGLEGGRHSAADLAIDPAFYDPGAVLDSLRLVDPATLAGAVLRAVSAEASVRWNVRGLPFSPRLGVRVEARLRDRIADFLDRKPRPMLIVPCKGVPVSRLSVTVMLARDLAVDAMLCIRATGEFRELEAMYSSSSRPEAAAAASVPARGGCPLFAFGTLLWWVVVFAILYGVVHAFLRRAEIARACQRFVWSRDAPARSRSADRLWSSLAARGYHVHRVR